MLSIAALVIGTSLVLAGCTTHTGNGTDASGALTIWTFKKEWVPGLEAAGAAYSEKNGGDVTVDVEYFDEANDYIKKDGNVTFEVEKHNGGLTLFGRRNGEPDSYYWRVTQWIFPWYNLIPPFGDHALGGHVWVPIDDHNCWAWSINFRVDEPLSAEERHHLEEGRGVHCEYEPGTNVPGGTWRPKANKDNDYLIDRQAQKERRSFSGVMGFAAQDASLQESMGPIIDRSKENLVSTDNGIIMARHRLLRALKAMEKGETPPGISLEHQRIRSAAVVLPPDKHFKDAAKEALVVQTGREHVTV